MRVRLLPYNMGSVGCGALANALGIPRIRRENSRYVYKDGDVIINWGCSQRPKNIPYGAKIINPFEAVALAKNKIKAFEVFDEDGVICPFWTESKGDVADRILGEGADFFARTSATGYGGKDIIEIQADDFADLDFDEVVAEIPDAPLYTQYVPKKSEYRVHVFNGNVIDLTRKALDPDIEDRAEVNWRIRNHANGFIFSRYNIHYRDKDGNPMSELEVAPYCVKQQAINAVEALGLDFGAVDVIYNKRKDRAYVLEVNTAPGIEGTTVDIYARYFSRYYGFPLNELNAPQPGDIR